MRNPTFAMQILITIRQLLGSIVDHFTECFNTKHPFVTNVRVPKDYSSKWLSDFSLAYIITAHNIG